MTEIQIPAAFQGPTAEAAGNDRSPASPRPVRRRALARAWRPLRTLLRRRAPARPTQSPKQGVDAVCTPDSSRTARGAPLPLPRRRAIAGRKRKAELIDLATTPSSEALSSAPPAQLRRRLEAAAPIAPPGTQKRRLEAAAATCAPRRLRARPAPSRAPSVPAPPADPGQAGCNTRAAAVLGSAPRSDSTWRAALKRWHKFAESELKVTGDTLPPTVDQLCQWGLTFKSPGTWGNYRAQLFKACSVLDVDTSAFEHEAVSRVAAAVRKRAQRKPAPKPFADHTLLTQLCIRFRSQALRVLCKASFAFAARMPSELVQLQVGDPSAQDPGAAGHSVFVVKGGSALLHLARRKHVEHASVVERLCWCDACTDTCPVHAVGKWICSFPVGCRPFAQFGKTDSAGRAALKPIVQSTLRRAAKAAGADDHRHFTSKVFRRGHAETLRRGGGRLAHILKGGTWSSAAFKEYLSQHDLVRDAMAESIALLSAQPQ